MSREADGVPLLALESMPSDDLRRAGGLYAQIKELRLRLTNVQEDALDRAFEAHVTGVMDKLEARLASINDPRLRHIEVVMANHGLTDASFQQLVLLCQTISPGLGEIVKTIRTLHSSFLSDIQKTSYQFLTDVHDQSEEISNLKHHIQNSEMEISRLMEVADLLDKEAEDNQKTIVDLRDRIRRQEIELLHLTSGPGSGAPLTATQVTALSSGKQSMVTGGGSDTIFGAGKSNAANAQSTSTGNLNPTGNGSSLHQLGTLPRQPGENWIFLFRSDLQRAMDTPNKCRAMTINETRETTNQLFDSKAAANIKAMKTGGLPMETMEMHVYKTIEKKYGLRSLAAEHTGALLLSIQKYASQDNTIMVFMKVFSNEVEEDFRDVQLELKRSITDLLRVQIMSKYPSKDQQSINAILEDRLNGSIAEEEWCDVVNYLYNSTDSGVLNSTLRSMALGGDDDSDISAAPTTGSVKLSQSPGMKGKASLQISSREQQEAELKKYGYLRSNVKLKKVATRKLSLLFEDVLKCILDFQLKNHEKFLSRFLSAFRQVDSNLDGVINHEEFRHLFMDIRFDGQRLTNVPSDDLNDAADTFRSLLSVVDPHSNNRITFSSAAACLSRLGGVVTRKNK